MLGCAATVTLPAKFAKFADKAAIPVN